MANIDPQDEMPEESRNSLNPIGTVYFCGEFKYNNWLKKSSHVHRKVNSTVVITAGKLKGMIIFM